jgi:hypothetical protein
VAVVNAILGMVSIDSLHHQGLAVWLVLFPRSRQLEYYPGLQLLLFGVSLIVMLVRWSLDFPRGKVRDGRGSAGTNPTPGIDLDLDP